MDDGRDDVDYPEVDRAGGGSAGFAETWQGSTATPDRFVADARAAVAEQYADPTAIRRGVEHAQIDLGSVAMNASVWEGREGWADHPLDDRQRAGQTALGQLERLIDGLGDLRIRLRAALHTEADPDITPPVVHAVTPIDMPRSWRGVRPGPLCGATGSTALSSADATCPECRALLAERRPGRAVTHYTATSNGAALCGAEWPDGTVSPWAADVTCPQCSTELAR